MRALDIHGDLQLERTGFPTCVLRMRGAHGSLVLPSTRGLLRSVYELKSSRPQRAALAGVIKLAQRSGVEIELSLAGIAFCSVGCAPESGSAGTPTTEAVRFYPLGLLRAVTRRILRRNAASSSPPRPY